MGLREGSGMLCIASMHRFRVTRGAKWALSRGADETVCILLQGDEEEEERLGDVRGGCGWVGQDRRHGARRPTSPLWAAARVETSPQSGSCLKQCCTSSKALRAAKIASFSLQPTDPTVSSPLFSAGTDCKIIITINHLLFQHVLWNMKFMSPELRCVGYFPKLCCF